MLRVHFKSNWFAPNHHLYLKSDSRFDLREVPTEFEKLLPKSAKIVLVDEEPAKEPLTTTSALDKKFEEAAHQREVMDIGLQNALAISKAQTGVGPKSPADIAFNDGATASRAETKVAIQEQNAPVTEDDLAAALARKAQGKK